MIVATTLAQLPVDGRCVDKNGVAWGRDLAGYYFIRRETRVNWSSSTSLAEHLFGPFVLAEAPGSGVTHAQKPGDRRQITMCGQYVAGVQLADAGAWPTCRACCGGIEGTRGVQKALGLASKGGGA